MDYTYKILNQREVEGRLVYDKVIRLSDETIYEVNSTETEKGKLIHIYFEDNDYRKPMFVFMTNTGENNYSTLPNAPLPIEIPKIVYWGANEKPPQLFWDKEGIMLGEKAREYHLQLKEWEHEIFVYDVKTKTFANRNNKKVTDFKYLFKM